MKKFKIIYLFVLSLVLIGCSSNVNIEIFRFVNHENKIQVGDTVNLDLILGEYSADSEITYLFSEEGIIDFSEGVAEGKAVGEVTVTATIDNIKFATTKVIVVKVPIDAMQIIAPKTKMFKDETIKFDVRVIPGHHSNEVTWSIEIGSDVAEISADGVLKPKRGEKDSDELNAGGARVRVVATSAEDKDLKAKIDIYVQYRKTTSITVTVPEDKVEFELAEIVDESVESIQLKWGILPLNANTIVTFSSSDATIMLVDANGLITFPDTPKAGVVTITVRSLDNVRGTITFTITEPEVPEEPEEPEEPEV